MQWRPKNHFLRSFVHNGVIIENLYYYLMIYCICCKSAVFNWVVNELKSYFHEYGCNILEQPVDLIEMDPSSELANKLCLI
ncbi:hypothetical protein WN943_008221 [Citrus x changshan-huyou]